MSEPSSASSIANSHLNYGGSRKEASRFRYKSKRSLSAFVELIPRCVPTPHELFEWLKNCKKLVDRVQWQSSKASQGNVGNHLCEKNIRVYPRCSSASTATSRFLEFELARNAHMSLNSGCPYTASVMFKDPPKDLVPHAWNILRHICRGKELFPEKVDEWMQVRPKG